MIALSEKTFMEIFKGKDSKYIWILFWSGKTSKIILVTSKVLSFLHFLKAFLMGMKNVYSVALNRGLWTYLQASINSLIKIQWVLAGVA